MNEIVSLLITVLTAVIASSGFWAFLNKHTERKDVRTKMLIGLGHDRIIQLGSMYIERGYITSDEYENLIDYLYAPYAGMGGNGSAKRVVEEVKKLPLHKS